LANKQVPVFIVKNLVQCSDASCFFKARIGTMLQSEKCLSKKDKYLIFVTCKKYLIFCFFIFIPILSNLDLHARPN